VELTSTGPIAPGIGTTTGYDFTNILQKLLHAQIPKLQKILKA